jgi:hypothetical protein
MISLSFFVSIAALVPRHENSISHKVGQRLSNPNSSKPRLNYAFSDRLQAYLLCARRIVT